MIYLDNGGRFVSADELYHHGILGQHWGKKNGPPYPLSAGDHSASEKKAGWRKSLDSNNASGGGRTSKSSSARQAVTSAARKTGSTIGSAARTTGRIVGTVAKTSYRAGKAIASDPRVQSMALDAVSYAAKHPVKAYIGFNVGKYVLKVAGRHTLNSIASTPMVTEGRIMADKILHKNKYYKVIGYNEEDKDKVYR